MLSDDYGQFINTMLYSESIIKVVKRLLLSYHQTILVLLLSVLYKNFHVYQPFNCNPSTTINCQNMVLEWFRKRHS